MITTILLLLREYWKITLIIGLLIPLGYLFWGWKQQYDANILKHFKIEQLKIVNEQLKKQQKIDQYVIDQLTSYKTKTDEENQILKDRLNDIEESPESDDGPIAPVLRRTLDRL